MRTLFCEKFLSVNSDVLLSGDIPAGEGALRRASIGVELERQGPVHERAEGLAVAAAVVRPGTDRFSRRTWETASLPADCRRSQ